MELELVDSPRMQAMLDALRHEDALSAMGCLQREAMHSQITSSVLMEFQGKLPALMPQCMMSSRMLITLWKLRSTDPETLSTKDARQIFCDQVAAISGEEVLSFQRAVEICQQAMISEGAAMAVNDYREQLIKKLRLHISEELSWGQECKRWADRIEHEMFPPRIDWDSVKE